MYDKMTCLGVDAAKPVDTANPFEDVKQGSWYYDAVQYVRVNGLFYGTSETAFTPDGTMTRGMFVTVLGRMALDRAVRENLLRKNPAEGCKLRP